MLSSSPSGTEIPTKRDAPWNAGLRAVRANLVPALIMQSCMLALVLLYFFYPPTRAILDSVAELKRQWSFAFSAFSTAIGGALIPEMLRIAVFQSGKINARNLRNLIFTIPFWAMMGIFVDLFYRLQALWFGSEASLSTVTVKVVVDQFLYSPLFAAPLSVWLYDWKNREYSFSGTGVFFTAPYYRDQIVPVLFAAWGVWIPMVTLIYSLPTLLQIPMFTLAVAMWVTLYTWMSENRSPTIT